MYWMEHVTRTVTLSLVLCTVKNSLRLSHVHLICYRLPWVAGDGGGQALEDATPRSDTWAGQATSGHSSVAHACSRHTSWAASNAACARAQTRVGANRST